MPAKDIEDRAARRLLQAASAHADELPAPSPFLPARVRALAAARAARTRTEHPLGRAAWQMLPALMLLVSLLSAVAGWQSLEATRQKQEALAGLLDPRAGGDVIFAAALLGGGPPEARP